MRRYTDSDRWSPTAHAAMGTAVLAPFAAPISAPLAALEQYTGSAIRGGTHDRSTGEYVKRGALGGAALGGGLGIGAGALEAFLKKNPKLLMNVLKYGAGGAAVGGVEGALSGLLGKASDAIGNE